MPSLLLSLRRCSKLGSDADDGEEKKTFNLNRAHYGLYVCPLIWRSLGNFSSGAVCMVAASEIYDENDYIRNYIDFKKFAHLNR